MTYKINKELLEIFDNKERSFGDYYIYENLTSKEKGRLFELLKNQKGGKKNG